MLDLSSEHKKISNLFGERYDGKLYIYALFIDYRKAFDNVKQQKMIEILLAQL